LSTRRLVIILLASFSSIGQQAAGQTSHSSKTSQQQFANLGEFKLQSGAVLHDLRLGYRTLGKLNAGRSNAILWPTWLGARSEDLLPFIGPGSVVDTNKYFVILVDSLGNGISSSPSNSRVQPLIKFPKFTIRDMVESEHQLTTKIFQLSHLHAVMGLSMGGMQAFEWAIVFPEFMDLAIPMNGSSQSTASDKLLWTSEIDAIELDPAWNNGNPKGPLMRGIALAAEIGEMNATSPTYVTGHTDTADFESFLAALRKSAINDAGGAWDQIRQREAILALDIPREFRVSLEQAAKHVRSKMLVIVSTQDHVVNPDPAIRFAKAIAAPIIYLDSPCGHRSLSCISVGPTVAQFLADPSSVHTKRCESLNALIALIAR
jgi:homoserine O-acetyltransferase/O-succinyltransferase